eukprot:RCo047314
MAQIQAKLDAFKAQSSTRRTDSVGELAKRLERVREELKELKRKQQQTVSAFTKKCKDADAELHTAAEIVKRSAERLDASRLPRALREIEERTLQALKTQVEDTAERLGRTLEALTSDKKTLQRLGQCLMSSTS